MDEPFDQTAPEFADTVKPQEPDRRICPRCGTTIDDLYRNGLMGCATCYEVFGDVVSRALVVLHGTSEHTGKTLS